MATKKASVKKDVRTKAAAAKESTKKTAKAKKAPAKKAAAKKSPTKKAPAKKAAAKKSPTKKAPAKKKATKRVTTPRLKKDKNGRSVDLRIPQVRILQYLLKSKKRELLRSDVSAAIPNINITEHLGAIRETAKANPHTISLTEKRLVKQEVKQDSEGYNTYTVSLTAAGKKLAASLK